MGSINFSLRDFYDSSAELVGVKSGLLLNRFQISKILSEKCQDKFLCTDNLNTYVRLHSSELEGMLLDIRIRIGNLPEILPSEKAYSFLRDYVLRTNDLSTVSRAPSIGLDYIRNNEDISVNELSKLLNKLEGYDQELCNAIAIIAFEVNDLSCIMPCSKKWSETTELSDLFNCELNSENKFLEQKFIDYLAINGSEIELIHWRNFERFCAEYFRKQGYDVKLGPGGNDGGVDIRVFKVGDFKAPEFMIQCKRYKTENKVSIETVKSFYTDVKYENAKTGLIATTSYIAEGGKKVTEARGYNIKFAENENIKKWAREMWTYK